MLTENTLWNIWRFATFNYQTPERKRSQEDAYESIAWYVSTGRSCLAWERALAKADPKKLIRYVLKQDNQSVEGQVASTTAYLRRYCKYPY